MTVTEDIDVRVHALQSETERRFVEQEHRFFHALSNLRKYWNGPDHLRRSSIIALGWAITSKAARSATTGGIGIVALISVFLAWKANALLARQNQTLDQQTMLIEAQRRASLNIELSSIWDQLRDEVPEQPPSVGFEPSNVLTARIVSVSRALLPYQSLEIGAAHASNAGSRFWEFQLPASQVVLRDRPLSPERGQLIQALAALGIDIETLSYRGATFAYADLSGQILSFPAADRVDLSRASFRGAIIWRTDFSHTNLAGADFACAYFEHVIFGGGVGTVMNYGIKFGEVDLGGFIVDHSTSGLENYRGFAGVHIHPDTLDMADLRGALLDGLRFRRESAEWADNIMKKVDRSRYYLMDAPGGTGDKIIKSRDENFEHAQRDAMNQRCEKERPSIDARIARGVWSDTLTEEWPGWLD
ncbi:pentapeptide repeat-containing protein [Sphingobium yanoikuyae]|uniref:pentapeptide repeat-containing protein n=1 Tax=Sphingobium yanoikuyae TaxID=13690 RepID=UPI0009B8AAFE|nr:pentapeptide repeat-containing protein [Sphingobium yanoikuyae]MDV3480849.1 pentapeptide repeat-containing protein [Sphingobium yanoikuyae]